MPQNPHATFTVDSAVELAVLERSGFIESRHLGSAVILAADGSVVTELGDITTPVFARSTLKPFQALAAMQSGVPLRGAQVAVACGSHIGSLDHMDVVSGMLKAAGVREDQLLCPEAWPQDETARNWLVRSERGRSRRRSTAPASTPPSSGPAPKTAGTPPATLSRTTRCSSASAPSSRKTPTNGSRTWVLTAAAPPWPHCP